MYPSNHSNSHSLDGSRLPPEITRPTYLVDNVEIDKYLKTFNAKQPDKQIALPPPPQLSQDSATTIPPQKFHPSIDFRSIQYPSFSQGRSSQVGGEFNASTSTSIPTMGISYARNPVQENSQRPMVLVPLDQLPPKYFRKVQQAHKTGQAMSASNHMWKSVPQPFSNPYFGNLQYPTPAQPSNDNSLSGQLRDILSFNSQHNYQVPPLIPQTDQGQPIYSRTMMPPRPHISNHNSQMNGLPFNIQAGFNVNLNHGMQQSNLIFGDEKRTAKTSTAIYAGPPSESSTDTDSSVTFSDASSSSDTSISSTSSRSSSRANERRKNRPTPYPTAKPPSEKKVRFNHEMPPVLYPGAPIAALSPLAVDNIPSPSGKRLYPCVCGELIGGSKTKVNHHINKHHFDGKYGPKDVVVCPTCQNTMLNENLGKHIAERHLKSSECLCLLCNSYFSRREVCMRHIRNRVCPFVKDKDLEVQDRVKELCRRQPERQQIDILLEVLDAYQPASQPSSSSSSTTLESALVNQYRTLLASGRSKVDALVRILRLDPSVAAAMVNAERDGLRAWPPYRPRKPLSDGGDRVGSPTKKKTTPKSKTEADEGSK